MSAAALPGQREGPLPEEKMDKSLQKENKKLKGDIKQMEMKIKAMQVELNKSFQMKDRLEALCRELQKQNKFIKAESSSKIQEANVRGKELAAEVQNNMGFMKSINENLAAISSESLTVKRENEELAKKIAILKGHYEEREQILQSALKETNESLQRAKLDTGETKLKSAEEKEKLIGEMQKLADALLQSREQIKEAKETEIALRTMIQSYEDKFNGLQKALKETNGNYEEFRSEMTKVSGRTKELEKETVKWQERWEESNIALKKMRQNYQKVQEDLGKSQDSLDKMKSLCRMLHNENRDLQAELKDEKGGSDNTTSELSDAAAETLAGITGSDVVKSPLEVKVLNHEAKKRDASAAAKKAESEVKNKNNEAPVPVVSATLATPEINQNDIIVAQSVPSPAASTETISVVPSPEAPATEVVLTDTNASVINSPKKEDQTPSGGPDTTTSKSPSSPSIDSNGNKSNPPAASTASAKEESQEEGKPDGESHKGKKNKRKNKNKK